MRRTEPLAVVSLRSQLTPQPGASGSVPLRSMLTTPGASATRTPRLDFNDSLPDTGRLESTLKAGLPRSQTGLFTASQGETLRPGTKTDLLGAADAGINIGRAVMDSTRPTSERIGQGVSGALSLASNPAVAPYIGTEGLARLMSSHIPGTETAGGFGLPYGSVISGLINLGTGLASDNPAAGATSAALNFGAGLLGPVGGAFLAGPISNIVSAMQKVDHSKEVAANNRAGNEGKIATMLDDLRMASTPQEIARILGERNVTGYVANPASYTFRSPHARYSQAVTQAAREALGAVRAGQSGDSAAQAALAQRANSSKEQRAFAQKLIDSVSMLDPDGKQVPLKTLYRSPDELLAEVQGTGLNYKEGLAKLIGHYMTGGSQMPTAQTPVELVRRGIVPTVDDVRATEWARDLAGREGHDVSNPATWDWVIRTVRPQFMAQIARQRETGAAIAPYSFGGGGSSGDGAAPGTPGPSGPAGGGGGDG